MNYFRFLIYWALRLDKRKIKKIQEYLDQRVVVTIDGRVWFFYKGRWSHSAKALKWDSETLSRWLYELDMNVMGLSL